MQLEEFGGDIQLVEISALKVRGTRVWASVCGPLCVGVWAPVCGCVGHVYGSPCRVWATCMGPPV